MELNEKQEEALKKVVDYLIDNEEYHFDECEGDMKEEHIFNDVLVLKTLFWKEDEQFQDWFDDNQADLQNEFLNLYWGEIMGKDGQELFDEFVKEEYKDCKARGDLE